MTGKVLVLDVDETLLTMEPVFYLERFHKAFRRVSGIHVTFAGREYYLERRPFALSFLEKVRQHFALVAWSLAESHVTKQKLQLVGLDSCFVCVLGKHDLVDGKKSVVRLAERLHIEANNIFAVDDRPELYDAHERVIRIAPWSISDTNDSELLKVLELIEQKTGEVMLSKAKVVETVAIRNALS